MVKSFLEGFGGFMSTFDSSGRGNLIRKILILLTVAGVVAAAFAWTPIAKTSQQPSGSADAASLLEGYRHVEVASVSDAPRSAVIFSSLATRSLILSRSVIGRCPFLV